MTDTYFTKSSVRGTDYSSPARAIHLLNRDSYYTKPQIPFHTLRSSLVPYYDLQDSFEQRYITDIEEWRSKATESEIKRDAAERENIRLAEELQFWRSKNFTADRQAVRMNELLINHNPSPPPLKLLDIELKDIIAKTKLEVLRRSSSGSRSNELLHVEIESLRNQLSEKLNEVEEWRRLYQRQELRSVETRSTTETQLRAYEA